jgi:hypothetical protein
MSLGLPDDTTDRPPNYEFIVYINTSLRAFREGTGYQGPLNEQAHDDFTAYLFAQAKGKEATREA